MTHSPNSDATPPMPQPQMPCKGVYPDKDRRQYQLCKIPIQSAESVRSAGALENTGLVRCALRIDQRMDFSQRIDPLGRTGGTAWPLAVGSHVLPAKTDFFSR